MELKQTKKELSTDLKTQIKYTFYAIKYQCYCCTHTQKKITEESSLGHCFVCLII